MVSCCPWRYSQKIYLQVAFVSLFKYSFEISTCFQTNNLWYIKRRLYILLEENIRQYLRLLVWSWYLLLSWKPFFPLMMSSYLLGWMGCKHFNFLLLYVSRSNAYTRWGYFFIILLLLIVLFCIGVWQNIFQIWKNILGNRLAYIIFTVSVFIVSA